MAATFRRFAVNSTIAVAAAAAAGMFTGSASAELSQPWTWCVNKEKASPDLQISGCTTVIQSGKETKKNLSIAFNNRGNGHRAKGDNENALADYNQSIRLDPNYSYPHNGRGNVYHDKKDYDHALADYDKAIRLDPKYASPYNGRGNVYQDKKDYDRAIPEYDQAIRLDPNYALAYKRPR
ncbi:MAG TPA: tetratricopeptide repeat protein [Xanthobacteraceae bacterium]|nr:tetratricopeptide repeat protein [Xanthobacteraceae bacterium]